MNPSYPYDTQPQGHPSRPGEVGYPTAMAQQGAHPMAHATAGPTGSFHNMIAPVNMIPPQQPSPGPPRAAQGVWFPQQIPTQGIAYGVPSSQAHIAAPSQWHNGTHPAHGYTNSQVNTLSMPHEPRPQVETFLRIHEELEAPSVRQNLELAQLADTAWPQTFALVASLATNDPHPSSTDWRQFVVDYAFALTPPTTDAGVIHMVEP